MEIFALCIGAEASGSHGRNEASSEILSILLARMFHELQSRDREDGCATGQPQGVGPEAYLNGTSQGATPEDARLPARRAYSSERRTPISAVGTGDSWNVRARRQNQKQVQPHGYEIWVRIAVFGVHSESHLPLQATTWGGD
jgi:hypothetical protein